jgi:hypothetical protein
MNTPPEKHLGLPVAASLVPLSLRETDRASLRPVVAELESCLTILQGQSDTDGYAEASATLAAQWRRLVGVMALGTAPELRVCPHCGHHINATAVRCIQCWKLSDREPRSLSPA